MGILRSDRVSGLGGANAINGSVKFGDSYLRIPYSTPDDFTFDGNFTIEYWYYPQPTGGDSIHIEYAKTTGYKRAWQVHQSHSSNTYSPRFWWWAGGSTTGSMTSSIAMTPNNWYHVAWVRIGTTLYNYVNGVSGGSSAGTSGITLGEPSDAEKPHQSLNIGVQIYNGPQLMLGGGHISNLRIIKGEGIYTAAFTPPTTRLEKTSNTVLLCCQSPGDVTKEETGKIIETNNIANSAPPQASTFVPDVGEDHGTTFEDNTKFDTLSYMVPPGGTTAQSNRGRAVLGGGTDGSSDYMNTIDYFSIPSEGNSIDFGDLSYAARSLGACSSSTRGLWAGGMGPASEVATNSISYITIATTANGSDFGDLSVVKRQFEGLSNQTRGIWPGGQNDTPSSNTEINSIDYVTIATTGNASDFGDIQETKESTSTCASSTRGLIAGGDDGPAYSNTIGYITIATTGNATNFGDLSLARSSGTGCSNETRGLFFGGRVAPNNYNTIEYVTIATTGNSSDFGDLTATINQTQSAASQIRGVLAGGNPNSSPNYTNLMEYVNIATTGNSSDFGDTTAIKTRGGTSDCHGGL